MPRAKAPVAASAPSRPEAARKKSVKTAPPKKKAKKVLVDVIADEPLERSAGFSEPSSETAKRSAAEPLMFSLLKKTSKEERAEIDQQNNFYSRLASEIKNKPDRITDQQGAKPKKNISLYRRLVWKFVILTAVLLTFVAYFSFSQLTVTIIPKGEAITDTVLLKVSAAPTVSGSATTTVSLADPREAVTGTVRVIEATAQKNYAATGQEFGDEEISGTVKVINNYNKSQALVATTRLLSPDNKLFRLKNAVNIPAGGQVTAEIYAEKPSADLAIGPTTFTIPGLWLGLQDKIYARSDKAFVFQQKIKKFVNPSDIQQATADIKNLLIANAQAEMAKQGGDWFYDTSEPAVVSFSAKPGEALEEFTATAQGKIIAVSFSKDQAVKLAAAKLNLLIPDDKTLTGFKPEEINYSLESYNPQDGSATIRASFTGTMMLRSDATIINRDQLVNLTKDQIDNYLQNFPEIKTYQLRFSPAFIHKAPSLVDRIKIKIETTEFSD